MPNTSERKTNGRTGKIIVPTCEEERKEEAQGKEIGRHFIPPKPPDKQKQRIVEICGLWKERNKSQQLIKINGTIMGQKAVFLIDCGATTEFIDEGFAKRGGMQIVPSGTRIKLADGAVSESAGRTMEIGCTLGVKRVGRPITFESGFELTKLSDYDAILGLSWFKAMKPSFKWGTTVEVRIKRRSKTGKMKWVELQNNGIGTKDKNRGKRERAINSVGKGEEKEDELLQYQGVVVPKQQKYVTWKVNPDVRKQEEEEKQKVVEEQREPEEEAVVKRLLKEFADVFPDELPAGLPPNRGLTHRIKLKPHTQPPYRRPYKCGPRELELLRITLEEMERKGFIKRSTSRYGAPTMFTPKKDGTPRMVIDYRELNKITVKNGYPLPNPDELFPMVARSGYYSKIDLHSGYYQIPISVEDREKTAFVTRYGSYEFLVLPMGLCNSPGTFMELMNHIFKGKLDRSVVVFLDDILIYSKTLEEHEKHLKEVMEILRAQRLYGKLSKCELVKKEVEFLGYFVGREGLRADPKKVQTVSNWVTPTDTTGVRAFLGCAGFYRKFIKGFSEIALPLTDLTGKGIKFQWGEKEEAAFRKLKEEMESTQVLALPDVDKPFVIHTDASGYATGAVLQQDQGRGLQPVAYLSEKMIQAERNYPTHEQEMLAVVKACDHWRHLLWGQEVTVYSDHASLKHFFGQRQLSKRQARWLEQLAELDLTIKYIKGEENTVADALSRRSEMKSEEETTQIKDIMIEVVATVTRQTIENRIVGAREKAKENKQIRRRKKAAQKATNEAATDDSAEVEQQRQKFKEAATKVLPTGSTTVQPDKQGVIVMPSQRCTAETATGRICKARTRGGQYCWTHLKKEEGLRIKQSKVAEAGKGLFAEKEFKKGETIALYTGDWVAVDDEAGGAYALQVSKTKIIDAARTNAGPGRWANDPRGTGRRANAELRYSAKNKVGSVAAKQKIKKGDEVLVSYGRQYWKDKKKQEEEECNTVTGTIKLREKVKAACEKDKQYQQHILDIQLGVRTDRTVVEGILMKEGRICLPQDEEVKTAILQEIHDTLIGGHLGRDKTAHTVKLRFYWERMDDEIEKYVTSCQQCQQNKVSHQKAAGLLMPIKIPDRPGQQISLDLIGPLPKTARGNEAIVVFVDKFTKMTHYVATKMSVTAPELARLFIQIIVRQYGVPESIVSDRDPRFTAHFWKAFWRQLQTTLAMSTAHHAQTDGQTERANRTLEDTMTNFVEEDQRDWDLHLPLLELAVNSTKQASTGYSPFFMLYGREAVLPIDVMMKTKVVTGQNPAADKLAEELKNVWGKAIKSMEKAQQRQGEAVNKKRREVNFEVGDRVLLSTRHIKMVGSKQLKRSVKFAEKFIGPYTIRKVVNANAYTLELPEQFQMHPTVNVTQLKRYVDGSSQFPSRKVKQARPEAVVLDDNGTGEWEVEKIVAERGKGKKLQYLVKWTGYPQWEATWTKEVDVRGAKTAVEEFKRLREILSVERLSNILIEEEPVFKGWENVIELESNSNKGRLPIRKRVKTDGSEAACKGEIGHHGVCI